MDYLGKVEYGKEVSNEIGEMLDELMDRYHLEIEDDGRGWDVFRT